MSISWIFMRWYRWSVFETDDAAIGIHCVRPHRALRRINHESGRSRVRLRKPHSIYSRFTATISRKLSNSHPEWRKTNTPHRLWTPGRRHLPLRGCKKHSPTFYGCRRIPSAIIVVTSLHFSISHAFYLLQRDFTKNLPKSE